MKLRYPTGQHVCLTLSSRCALAVLFALVGGLCPGRALSAQDSVLPRELPPDRVSLGADVSYLTFEGEIDPWQLGSLSLSRRTRRGSLIGRVNYADRFGSTGVQFEADAYPSLGGSTYAYLNAGYSKADIFPEWRFGGELFTSLPKAWEASLGFRQLRFGGSPVTLYTGALGKYLGNYWFSLRPYVRVKDEGLSASAGLTARRYFADGDNYVGLRTSYGSTPSERATITEIARTNSFSAGVHGSRGLASRLIGTWSLGYEREELTATRIRSRWEINVGARVDF